VCNSIREDTYGRKAARRGGRMSSEGEKERDDYSMPMHNYQSSQDIILYLILSAEQDTRTYHVLLIFL
jgi:hypothetical protein